MPDKIKRESGKFVLCLYVAGSTSKSTRAIKNLKAICEAHLPDCYALNVIDLYEQRERAREAQVVVAPTLVREWPLPVRRLVGDLSQTERVFALLELPGPALQP